MGNGYLTIQVRTGDDALPVSNAHVTLRDKNGKAIYETYTDLNGNTDLISLPAPDAALSLDPDYRKPDYSVWDVDVSHEKYVTLHVHGVEVVDTQTSILPAKMEPIVDEVNPVTDKDINIPDVGLLVQTRVNKATAPSQSVFRQVIIPDYITVHLGTPTNAAARNVRVRFSDYIKNVASSEIYSTWNVEALKANIYAILSFTLSRVYSQWYPSKGYPFTITSSTQYDQKYIHGRTIYKSIADVVDEIFNYYIKRGNNDFPFFSQYCDGYKVNNPGWLSQWGSEALAAQGYKALQILRYYYGDNISLNTAKVIEGVPTSFPGLILQNGICSDAVQQIQLQLNVIAGDFPAIPKITSVDGKFGPATEAAVRSFQNIFNMPQTGKVDFATWYRISYIYVAVSKMLQGRYEFL